jgi:hypothetical protein
MKKHYEIIKDDGTSWGRKHKGRYSCKYGYGHRYVRTYSELRQLYGDKADGIKVRQSRLNIPTLYDDLPVSKDFKRSWKDFTKKKRQWN